MQSTYQEPTYPVVRFLLRYQRLIGPIAGLLPVLAAVVWMWPDFHGGIFVASIVVGAIAGVLMQSYIEVLRIISDTLLPR